MLVQFTVENFLSFNEKTTFNMSADGADHQHPLHIVNEGIGKAPPLLRVAALYGANGAGKSNLVSAVGFAKRLITRGTRGDQRIAVTPFKLGNETERASRFEFIFTYEGVLYSYGFLLNATQILEEWLYSTRSKQEVRSFERVTTRNTQTTGRQTKVEFGSAFAGKSAKQKQFLEFVAQGTRPNQLFLTEARERNVTAVAPIIAWFENVLTVISAEAQISGLERMLYTDPRFAEFACAYLRDAGTGVETVSVEKLPLASARHFAKMPDPLQQSILQQLQETEENASLLLQDPFGGREREALIQEGQEQPALLRLKTQHRTADGRLVDFEISEESEGTERLLHLSPALFKLKNRSSVIFLDELDRRLHPLLSRYFISIALACAQDSKQSQLIFTTHETSLLDLDLLRRDEIWFVEKDRTGASQLYSLAEFNIRPDLKIQKGYLNGRFGAIPFVGDVCNLGWTQNANVSDGSPVEAQAVTK